MLRPMLAAAAIAFMTLAPLQGAIAASPSSCDLGALAGKWILFKTNVSHPQSSRCSITVRANGSFSGNKTCNDYQWGYKSLAYTIEGKIAISSSVNSCYVSITATAAGDVQIKAEGAINAEKNQISGFFTNSNPAVGPLSLVKVP